MQHKLFSAYPYLSYNTRSRSLFLILNTGTELKEERNRGFYKIQGKQGISQYINTPIFVFRRFKSTVMFEGFKVSSFCLSGNGNA